MADDDPGGHDDAESRACDEAGSRAGDEAGSYIDGVAAGDLADEQALRPTPEQHERLKDGLHGDELFEDVRRAERRYFVIGSGDESGPGERRATVCELLEERERAVAFRLEDFGFTADELELWAPAFDVLSAMASEIVGVLEDFDGGHVWELGFLYRRQSRVRNALWLLERVYEDEAAMRRHYDNGMAASHLAALEAAAGDRVLTWTDPSELPDVVASIP